MSTPVEIVHKVTCNTTLENLMNMSDKEHQNSIPIRIQKRWEKKQFVFDHSLPIFNFIPVQHSKVVVKDQNGVILAFQIEVPPTLMNILQATDRILPQQVGTSTKRGEYSTRHYALWSDYSRNPYMSKELLDDGKHAQKWLRSNANLFQYLS